MGNQAALLKNESVESHVEQPASHAGRLAVRFASYVAFAYAVYLAVAIFLKSRSFRNFANTDSAAFVAFGRMITRGFVPYKDFWDHKPPMIYLVTALGELITPGNPFGATAIFLTLMLATFFVWNAIARRRRMAVGTSLASVTLGFCVLIGHPSTISNWLLVTEPLVFCFMSFAIYFAMGGQTNRWRSFRLGIFVALASLSKQNCLADGIGVMTMLLCAHGTLHVALAMTGALFVFLILNVVFFFLGGLTEAWECFLFNFSYAKGRLGLICFAPAFYRPAALFAIGIALWIWGRRHDKRTVGFHLPVVGMILWFLSAVLTAGSFVDYMPLLWPSALFAFVLGASRNEALFDRSHLGQAFWIPLRLLDRVDRTIGRKVFVVGLLVVVGTYYQFRMKSLYYVHPDLPKINRAFSPSTRAFVFSSDGGWEWEGLNFTPASRYVYLSVLARYPQGIEARREIMETLHSNPPDCIIFAKELHPFYEAKVEYTSLRSELRDWMAGRYREMDLGLEYYKVFRRGTPD